MNKLTGSQQNILKQFREITNCSQKQAIALLTKSKWNMQDTLNVFFQQGIQAQQQEIPKQQNLEKLFNQLSEEWQGRRVIKEDNILPFISKKFQIDFSNVVMGHIMLNVMNIKTPGIVEKNQFYNIFTHTKYQKSKQTTIQFTTAVELWKIYLKPIMAYYNQFMNYIQQLDKKPARVYPDLWNMVYEFAKTHKKLDNYDSNDAWPIFIDEFVEYLKKIPN